MSRNGSVLVAMSGGVDSSTAALLLQRDGYDCVGVTMQLYDSIRIDCTLPTCCSVDDIEDARKVAATLGMPFHVLDFREQFERDVIQRFVAEYQAGRTPNPCVDCNRYLKFGALMQAADDLGCNYLATGHYARIEHRADGAHLLKGMDAGKDQSYVLGSVPQQQLQRVVLPLGAYTKEQVRALASEAGLVNAEKHESQDICFIPDGDYLGFLERYTGQACEPGDIVDTAGKVLGRHHGIAAYTIGQRQGLGVAVGHPLYVCGKDATANRLVVGEREDLACREVVAKDWNWIARPASDGDGIVVQAKIRYREEQHACTVLPTDDPTCVRLRFDEPEYGVAPGQLAVVYRDDEVLGGGTITATMA